MYDYLNNFHKRMEKLSYSFLIDNKASTLTFFKDYFTDIQLINITYTLMVFVLERSLKDEECTLHDMTEFLNDIIPTYYNPSLNEEMIYEITRNIIYKILRNDGKPFIFDTINYKTGEKVAYNFHLLQQKPSKQDFNKSTFYLEKEGYQLLLGALEVDEKTQIDINQMILELSLKKKNFAQGVMAVEQLTKLITAQINILTNFIYKTRENIFAINHKDFEENFIKNLDVLKEQNEKFEELKNTIEHEEERLYNLEGDLKHHYESLSQLGKIKEQLRKITDKASALIGKHFEFKEEYRNALEEASLYYNNKRIVLKDDIIKPIEENPILLGEVHRLFNPLFKRQVGKKFNINYMFNEQPLYAKDEDELEVIINDEIEDDSEVEELLKQREEYKQIVSSLIQFILNKEQTSLKELIDYYSKKTDEEYLQMIPSIRKFSEVLIELLRIGVVKIEEIIKQQNEAYQLEELLFDLRQLLVDELKGVYQLRNIQELRFYKDETSEKVEIKERVMTDIADEFSTVEVLRCPNIIMTVK